MEIIINKFFEFDDEGIKQLKAMLKNLILDLQNLSNLEPRFVIA